jgi:hypothetical protein
MRGAEPDSSRMWPLSSLPQQLVKTDGRLIKHAPDVSLLRVASEADFRDGVICAWLRRMQSEWNKGSDHEEDNG